MPALLSFVDRCVRVVAVQPVAALPAAERVVARTAEEAVEAAVRDVAIGLARAAGHVPDRVVVGAAVQDLVAQTTDERVVHVDLAEYSVRRVSDGDLIVRIQGVAEAIFLRGRLLEIISRHRGILRREIDMNPAFSITINREYLISVIDENIICGNS